MSDVFAVALQWAADTGVPNALFVAALLTRPSTWTNRVVALYEKQFGGGGE